MAGVTVEVYGRRYFGPSIQDLARQAAEDVFSDWATLSGMLQASIVHRLYCLMLEKRSDERWRP